MGRLLPFLYTHIWRNDFRADALPRRWHPRRFCCASSAWVFLCRFPFCVVAHSLFSLATTDIILTLGESWGPKLACSRDTLEELEIARNMLRVSRARAWPSCAATTCKATRVSVSAQLLLPLLAWTFPINLLGLMSLSFDCSISV